MSFRLSFRPEALASIEPWAGLHWLIERVVTNSTTLWVVHNFLEALPGLQSRRWSGEKFLPALTLEVRIELNGLNSLFGCDALCQEQDVLRGDCLLTRSFPEFPQAEMDFQLGCDKCQLWLDSWTC